MYPAAAFNSGQITIDDLPDTVLVGGVFPLSKNNPPIDVFVNVETPFLIYYGVGGEGFGIENGEGPWKAQIDFGTGIESLCLFTNVGSVGDWLGDDFEETYTVNVSGIEIPFSGTATRRSLCEWYFEGDPNTQESAISIFYYDGENSPLLNEISAQIGWYAILGEISTLTRKDDPQNGPFGTYNLGDPVTVTVS